MNSMYRKIILNIIILALPAVLNAAVFTSSDGQFSMDMPSGWAATAANAENSVLSLSKGGSKIEFKFLSDCDKEACVEQKVNDDLLDVRNRKMKVLGNSYTGEDIKRVEFATGEPLMYISFSTPKTDFSAGYFLINKRAYSVLAQNVTYAEADLFFSFISPKAGAAAKTYDTYSLPQVEHADILPTIKDFKVAVVEEPKKEVVKKEPALSALAKIKRTLAANKNFTFVSKNMPPVIRELGRLFDIVVLLFALYVFVFFASLILKFFIKGGAPEITANPASAYPIKFKRLYGTPSLIHSARDNQGNTFISFNTRWGTTFEFIGAIFIMVCVSFMCAVSFNETFGLVKMHQFHYTTSYSVSSLILAIGFFIFALGLIISLVSLREFTLYNKNGKKSVYVLQKGYGIKREIYTIYYAHTKETLTLERKKFALKRSWSLLDSRGDKLAGFEEVSTGKAVLRKFFGHMWGMLRASYAINGVLDSKGYLKSHNTIFNAFTANIDKPQAIDALDMLVAGLVINIRDSDSWHPSAN
ncbi:hypothetical protein AAIR98_001622 [Elusimicrobium simillimum]|uniref:hypothetical protein n=1 Tax=Elusimicrobium simillimum TaxID=3143438 RepID=UPI003C6FC5CF